MKNIVKLSLIFSLLNSQLYATKLESEDALTVEQSTNTTGNQEKPSLGVPIALGILGLIFASGAKKM